jgi:hypothetical protein
MRYAAALSVGVLMAAVGCVSGQGWVSPAFDSSPIQRVAVVDVEGGLPGLGARNAIGDYFAMEFTKRGYTMVDRSQVAALLAEQDFQRSDMTSSEGAARAGRILNVDAVVVVNVAEFGQRITLTAKMLDAEGGAVLWIASASASTGKVLATATGAAVGAAAGATVGHGSGRVLAGTAGAALGGIAGYSLSPGELRATEKAVARACKFLPYRGGA